MSKKSEAWGIEVGAQAIKVMKLARSGSGVALEDFEVLPFKHVLTTPDLNVEEAIRVSLESLAQKHEFEKSQVVVSVPGHMAFARFAKLPPVESKNVKSIVGYEAEQQIPFPIDEVEWDYQVFEQEDAPDIEVGIFAITKERVANFLSNYRSVGLRVDALTLSPVAVYNAFAYDSENESKGDSVYLDIGTVSTDIIIVESGGIWLRTLPLGGNHFTKELMKQFKISFTKAEKLKLEAGTSKYAKQIFQAMRSVFSDLVSEIQRSLGFYQSLNRDADLTRIVGVGSTWKLPGLQKYLQQNLQMEVVRPDGFSRLEIDGRRAAEFSSVAVNMATAYGLALQGLGVSTVDANILPQAILRQRMWKAKQPWFGAAAACVAGAAAIGPIMQLMAGSSFDAAYSESFQKDINDTVQLGQQFKNRYANEVVANDPRPGIRNFRRSFDYANLYPKLLEDVTEAMATIEPHPDLQGVNWNSPSDLEKIAKIARPDRKLVRVTSITTEYELPQSAIPDPADGTLAPSGAEDFGAPPPGSDFGPFPGDEFGDGLGGGFPGGDFGSEFGSETDKAKLTPVPFPEEEEAFDPIGGIDEEAEGEDAEDKPVDYSKSKAPRIIVTVSGETTMDRPTIAGLLREKFEGWLDQNTKRQDRPYILVAELTDTQFTRRGTAATTDTGFGGESGFGGLGGGGEDALRRTPKPKIETQPGLNELGPGSPLVQPGSEGFDGFGPGFEGGAGNLQNIEVKTPEGWYASLDGSGAGFSFGALLPQRPLSIEENSDDVLFTFKFEVILLSPDDARKTILPPDPSEESEDEEPDTPTAQNPAPAAGQENES